MALTSIIIATRNRAAALPRSVESARRAGDEVEVVVVDDASTDNTPEACRNLENVQVIRLPRHTGLAGARNVGIRASTGEYVTFLDDDDLRLADSLPRQLKALEADPAAAFVYGQIIVSDDVSTPSGSAMPADCPAGDIFWQLVRQNFIHVGSVVVKRERLLEVGLFDPVLPAIEDWDLWLRLCERWPVAAIAEPVAIYRQFRRDSSQLSSNRARMCAVSAFVQKRALALPRAMAAPIEHRRDLRERYAKVLWYNLLLDCICALRVGAKAEARRDLWVAFKARPRHAFGCKTFRALLKSAGTPSWFLPASKETAESYDAFITQLTNEQKQL